MQSPKLPQLDARRVKNVCCIGAGYVGGPTCSVIASKNADVTVNVVDLNKDRISAWQSDDLPIAEPNLIDVVRIGRDGSDGRTPNLHFSIDVEQAIEDAGLIFIAVNTPTKRSGYGAGQALDVTYIESAVETIARVASNDKIIVEKSTVPCGTANAVKEILNALGRQDVHFEILSNPEFLAEGTAVRNLLDPDRVLIGSDLTDSGLAARASLSSLYSAWVPSDRIITMNIYSAELSKLTANALLAQRISSINAISAICEATGADVEEVAFAVGLDTRIGPRMLKASVGFGGSCLKKDVLNLAHFSDTLQLPEIGSYWRSVNDINELQKNRFAQRIVRRMNNTLIDKRIAVLGCAFKKNTSDIRESAAISLLVHLVAEEAEIAIYDPQVRPEEVWDVLEYETRRSRKGLETKLHFYATAYDACNHANAVIISTEWDEFSNREGHVVPPSTFSDRVQTPGPGAEMSGDGYFQRHMTRLDWSRVAKSMRYPKIVFDGRNVVDGKKLLDLGMQVECIGKPSLRR